MDAVGHRFERELRGYRGPNGEDGGWRISVIPLEGFLLTAVAAAVGLLFARWGIDLLVALGPNILPRAQEITIDGRVFGFTALVALVISVVFGLVPLRHVVYSVISYATALRTKEIRIACMLPARRNRNRPLICLRYE